MRYLLAVPLLLLIPAHALAAPSTFSFSRSLVVASSSPGNSYNAGTSIIITGPVFGDLAAIGGSIVSAASVQGDEFLMGGTINTRSLIGGDLRAIGGRIAVEAPVRGDLIALGYSVEANRAEGGVFIGALNTMLSRGAGGPVTIYGNNVALGGTFGGDVRIVASGHVGLAADTRIKGVLTYEAPQPASIPDTVVIEGGVKYTNASYLPDVGTSRILAVISIAVFLLARIIGALILAGLLAGLFPRLAEAIADRLYTRNARSILLTMLLGFGILAATPILIVLLLLTFVGIGLGLLLFVLYGLLAFLSVLYAGILIGSMFARRFARRDRVLWRDGVLGMLVFSLIALLPVIGMPILFLFVLFSAGALLQLFFAFAFPHE